MNRRKHPFMSTTEEITKTNQQIRKETEVKTIATTEIEKVENDNSLRLGRSMEHAITKKQLLLTLVIALGLLSVLLATFGRLRTRRASHPGTLLRPPSFKPLEQPPARSRAQSMRFASPSIALTLTITTKRDRSRAVIARSTGTAGTPPTWPRRSAGTRSMAFWSRAARFSPRTAPRSSRLRPRD